MSPTTFVTLYCDNPILRQITYCDIFIIQLCIDPKLLSNVQILWPIFAIPQKCCLATLQKECMFLGSCQWPEPMKFQGPTEIWTRIAGFKVLSANHYTMGPHMMHLLFCLAKTCTCSRHSFLLELACPLPLFLWGLQYKTFTQKSNFPNPDSLTGWPISWRASLGWVIFYFGCTTILPSCPANSAIFPSAQADLGRQWNDPNRCQPKPGDRPCK